MRNGLGIIINEDRDGVISVQLHSSPEDAKKSFKNIHGKASDEKTRVSFIGLDFKNNKTEAMSKILPVEDISKDKQPDGIVLGKGPIWLDKETDDDKTNG